MFTAAALAAPLPAIAAAPVALAALAVLLAPVTAAAEAAEDASFLGEQPAASRQKINPSTAMAHALARACIRVAAGKVCESLISRIQVLGRGSLSNKTSSDALLAQLVTCFE